MAAREFDETAGNDPRTPRRRYGDASEDLVVRYLRSFRRYLFLRRYAILGRNIACPFGEMDIIAYDHSEQCWCFVEVKARQDSTAAEHPGEAVTPDKMRKIIRSAEWWMRSRGIPLTVSIRFDVAMVFGIPDGSARIEYLENAFSADEAASSSYF